MDDKLVKHLMLLACISFGLLIFSLVLSINWNILLSSLACPVGIMECQLNCGGPDPYGWGTPDIQLENLCVVSNSILTYLELLLLVITAVSFLSSKLLEKKAEKKVG